MNPKADYDTKSTSVVQQEWQRDFLVGETLCEEKEADTYQQGLIRCAFVVVLPGRPPDDLMRAESVMQLLGSCLPWRIVSCGSNNLWMPLRQSRHLSGSSIITGSTLRWLATQS